MKILILIVAGILAGCASSPQAENSSGLSAKVANIKKHPEGLDITVALHNTTKQSMRLLKEGSVSVLLNGDYRIKGSIDQALEIEPGQRATAKMKFGFVNVPGLYKNGLIEIAPVKIFRSCKAADADPEVVREEPGEEGRGVASEVEADTCNRSLKRPIRIAF